MTDATESAAFQSASRERTADRLGLWVFIASEALLFGAVILTYLILRLNFPRGFAEGSRELSFWLGTINTGVLPTSSLTMALAESFAEDGLWRRARVLLAATALLGIVFLALKAVEYRDEYAHGLAPLFGLPFNASGPDVRGTALFMDLYFTMTGLHGLHLIAGVILVAGVALLWSRSAAAKRRRRAGALALYWHFVDIIWVFLYPLLYLISR